MHIVYEAHWLKATEALSVLIVTFRENKYICVKCDFSHYFALYESVELMHDLKKSTVCYTVNAVSSV